MAERSEAVEPQAVRDGSATYSVEADIAVTENVPLGYKRTEVGVIPEDWVVLRLGDRATFKKGYGLSKADLSENGSHQCIHYGQLYTLYVEVINEVFSRTDSSQKNATVSRENDVLMPTSDVTPTGLATASCLTQGNVYLGGDILAIRPDTNELSGEYLAYAVKVFRHIIMRLVSGTTVYHLYPRDMAQFRFPVPNVGEQRAIATALSDADALIESLDRLIAKKRAIKQAAMQQLLTGQTRLPGFTGEWETKRLGDVGTFYKGQGIRRDDVSDEGVPCIRYGEIYTRYGDCVLTPESRIPKAVAEAAFPLRTGDILFAGSGETVEEIGMCVAYLGQQPAFAGGDIVVLRPNEGVSAYLGRLLNHPTIAQKKARLGQGDAVVHISARNLAQIEVHLPKQEEQTAIAAVLSDMDTEIEALERRRDRARQIKQGMMQQLLTGRVRLVTPEVAA